MNNQIHNANQANVLMTKEIFSREQLHFIFFKMNVFSDECFSNICNILNSALEQMDITKPAMRLIFQFKYDFEQTKNDENDTILNLLLSLYQTMKKHYVKLEIMFWCRTPESQVFLGKRAFSWNDKHPIGASMEKKAYGVNNFWNYKVVIKSDSKMTWNFGNVLENQLSANGVLFD